MPRYYVLVIREDVELKLIDPYVDIGNRDHRARAFKAEYRDNHGVYALNLESGRPEVHSWSSGLLEEEIG